MGLSDKRTIELGSRKRGARALQTSETAPSSDQVAAMIDSMYCTNGQRAVQEIRNLRITFDFGGAFFGLQASLTILS